MAEPAPAPAPSPAPAPPAPPAPAPAARAPAPPARSPSGPISDQAYDQLGPGPNGQGAYARVRDQNDNPQWVPRSDLAPDPGPAPKPAAPAPGEPPAPAPAATVTEDGKLRIGDFELCADDIASLMQTKATADLRASQIPATPADYKAELPATFKMPDGLEGFTFNEADPAFRDLRAWAHGRGFDQQTFSEMIGFYAASEAAKRPRSDRRRRRKLRNSARWGRRVTAVETWLRGTLGDDLGGAVRGMIVSEKIVRGLEALASKFTTQGSAPFSQAHRAPNEPQGPGPRRASEAEYNAMSQAERFAYSAAIRSIAIQT